MQIISMIIGWAVGMGGLVFSVITHIKRQKERLHRQQRFEWNHIYQGVRHICRLLQRSGFRPDFMIGIPGGGLIPTELAVIEMGDDVPVFMIQQVPNSSLEKFPSNSGAEFKTRKWRYWIPPEILGQKDKRVLILEDYAPSGDSLTLLKEKLIENGFKKDNVKTALIVSPETLKEPNKSPDLVWFWVDSIHVYMPWGHASKRVRKGEIDSG